MTKLNNRQRCLIRLAIIAIAGAMVFSALLYASATASTTILLRLWHDQDSTGAVTDGDIVAAGVEVTVTELCTKSVCASSPTFYTVTTDSAGYATVTLYDGEYEVTAPCMAIAVAAADTSGQAVQDMATCGLWRVWLANIWGRQ